MVINLRFLDLIEEVIKHREILMSQLQINKEMMQSLKSFLMNWKKREF